MGTTSNGSIFSLTSTEVAAVLRIERDLQGAGTGNILLFEGIKAWKFSFDRYRGRRAVRRMRTVPAASASTVFAAEVVWSVAVNWRPK